MRFYNHVGLSGVIVAPIKVNVSRYWSEIRREGSRICCCLPNVRVPKQNEELALTRRCSTSRWKSKHFPDPCHKISAQLQPPSPLEFSQTPATIKLGIEEKRGKDNFMVCCCNDNFT